MRRFILKSMTLVVSLVVFLVSLWLLSNFVMGRNKNHFLQLNGGTDVVFAGDSNIECGIDDGLVGHSINIAHSGEPYLYTYYKLKALLACNPQIRTVFLGYAFHDIEMSTQEKWLAEDSFVIGNLKISNYLMDWPGNRLVFGINPRAYLIGLRDAVILNIARIAKGCLLGVRDIHHFDFGGFQPLHLDRLAEDSKIQLGKTYDGRLSPLQVEYLRRIHSLCQADSVRLVLLNTPKHRFYLSHLEGPLKEDWKRLSANGDSLLDLCAYPLPDSCFGDLSHLNYRGSRVFSEDLDKRIRAGDGNRAMAAPAPL